MSDIMERLLQWHAATGAPAYKEGAAEIERLRADAELAAEFRLGQRAEIERLRAALEILAGNDLNETNCASVEVAAKRVRNIARAALAEAKP